MQGICSVCVVYVQRICVCAAYMHICSVCAAYMQAAAYMQHMCSVYAAYVQRICCICAAYMQRMCSVCAAYVQAAAYVTNLLHAVLVLPAGALSYHLCQVLLTSAHVLSQEIENLSSVIPSPTGPPGIIIQLLCQLRIRTNLKYAIGGPRSI